MDNAGVYLLGRRAITAALTDVVITEGRAQGGAAQAFIDRLRGASSITVLANFNWTTGGSGTAAVLVIQTSLDQGQTWVDIIRMDFAQVDRVAHATAGVFAGAAPAAVAALGAEGKLDNVLGDMFRAKLTTTGAYVSTQLDVFMAVR